MIDERAHHDIGREAVHPASLHRTLEEDYPRIEAGIADYLVRRGGLHAAAKGLRSSIDALRRHIYLEEEFLFPVLREAGMLGPIFAMSSEHLDLWSTLDRMEEQLSDGSSQEARDQTCRILRAELGRHAFKEDPIVFGHTDGVLSPEQLATVRELIENASLPPGWACQAPTYE